MQYHVSCCLGLRKPLGPDKDRFHRSGLTFVFRTVIPCSILLVSSGLSVAEDTTEPPAAPISKTVAPLKIDGVLDEPVWRRAKAVRGDYISGQVGKLSNAPRMTARYAWDGDYLYIGYETFDRNLVAVSGQTTDGPPDNRRRGCVIWQPPQKVDVVEFFISLGDERFFWEIHHNAANQFNDVWCTVFDKSWPVAKSARFPFGIHFGDREFLQDDAESGNTLAMAARPKPKSTVNDDSDTDSGYTAELRVPWFGLGPPTDRQSSITVKSAGTTKQVRGPWKMVDQTIMILAVVQDGDLEQRYHHSSPTFAGGWFHKHAADWPRYLLRP